MSDMRSFNTIEDLIDYLKTLDEYDPVCGNSTSTCVLINGTGITFDSYLDFGKGSKSHQHYARYGRLKVEVVRDILKLFEVLPREMRLTETIQVTPICDMRPYVLIKGERP